MQPTSSTSNASARDAGFALLEAVLALAILAFLAAAAALALPREQGNSVVCAAAMRIASVLESDRNAALRLGKEVTTYVDAAAGLVRSDIRGRKERLPAGVLMVVDGDGETVRFLPDGRSSGLAMLVHSTAGACTVDASAVTGYVTVTRAELPQ